MNARALLHVLIVPAVAALLISARGGAATGQTVAPPLADDAIARGRMLVNYGGCNDCHTAGWRDRPGEIPEAQRLTGVAIGFAGPWGTSYPINLRLFFAKVPEARWLAMAAGPRRTHPPMPWWNIEQLTPADRHAIYAYVHSLGEIGGPVPDFIPPGGKVTTPVIQLDPPAPPA